MKINKFGMLAALCLGSLLVTTNFANAQEAKGKRPSVQDRLDRLSEELSLTDDQKPKVKAVLEETDKKFQEIPREERREKGATVRAEESKKMKEILKAEQFEKYEKYVAQRRGGGPPGEKKGEKKGDDKKE